MVRPPEPEFAWYRLQWREVEALALLLAVAIGLFAFASLRDSGVQAGTLVEGELPPTRVNVNTATVAELTTLPGIGERKAERIVAARGTRKLRSIDELVAAAGGIPTKDRERLTPYVVFE